jgi:hypothetical protein
VPLTVLAGVMLAEAVVVGTMFGEAVVVIVENTVDNAVAQGGGPDPHGGGPVPQGGVPVPHGGVYDEDAGADDSASAILGTSSRTHISTGRCDVDLMMLGARSQRVVVMMSIRGWLHVQCRRLDQI